MLISLDAEGEKNGDIGVENATPQAIIKALEGAKFKEIEEIKEYTMEDLFYLFSSWFS